MLIVSVLCFSCKNKHGEFLHRVWVWATNYTHIKPLMIKKLNWACQKIRLTFLVGIKKIKLLLLYMQRRDENKIDIQLFSPLIQYCIHKVGNWDSKKK